MNGIAAWLQVLLSGRRRGRVPIARRNLSAEPVRFGLSVLGVGLAILLAMVVLAVFRGWSGVGEIVTELPGSLWVTQEGTANPFNSGSTIDPADEALVRVDPAVATVIPVRTRIWALQSGDDDRWVSLMALDATEIDLPADVRERFVPGSGRIVIDEAFARRADLGLGDDFRIHSVTFRIAGIGEGGNAVFAQFAFIDWEDARRLFAPATATTFLLVQSSPGADVAALQASLQERLPNTRIFTSDEFAATLSQEVNDSFLPVLGVILGLGIAIAGAVIVLMVYTATVERRREYAILKAIGADTGVLLRIVLQQTLVVGVGGFIVGAIGAVAATALAAELVPQFVSDVRLLDVGGALVASITVASVAALVPTRYLAGVAPASVFRA